MARIIVRENGVVYKVPATTTLPVAIPLISTYLYSVSRRPCGVRYKRSFYMAGPWNQPVVFTQDYKLWPMGIQPPTNPPTLTATGSATAVSITGDVYGYITFVEKLPNGVWVAESNPSDKSNVLSSPGPLTWSNIPTFSTNPRVTHVRGYRSDEGGLPKLAWEIPLGTSSVIDLLSTASLAARESLPEEDGSLTFERGVPPYAKYLENYHDRMWFAGDTKYPDRIYYSKLFEPEAVGASNYLTTRDGEAVTGIKRVGDQLIVFCRRCCYLVTGWSGDDFKIEKLNPSVGCLSHYGIVNINERLWFPSERGVYIYDGGFRYAMDTIDGSWQAAFLANPSYFENSTAENDALNRYYRLQLDSPTGTYYYGNYGTLDVLDSDRSFVKWTTGSRTRKDTAQGLWLSPGTGILKLYTGSSDGYVREENVDSNANDDSDAGGKTATLLSKHFFFDDPGGDNEDGKMLVKAWSYVKNETAAWTFSVFGGDEEAATQIAANSSDAVPASAVTDKVAKTRHFHPVREKTTGHGFSFKYVAAGSTDFKFRGFGGVYGPGPSYRGSTA